MKIELHLYASLAKYLPSDAVAKTCFVNTGDSVDVDGIIERMNIPAESVKLVFVNGIHADRQAPLKDGDRVGLFPPVGGG